MVDDVYFRAGVGLLLLNAEGLLLVAERADPPGAWQAPQGGLRRGEDILDAAERELSEETGIPWDRVEVVAVHPEWLAYELPAASRSEKTGRGQVQRWVLLRFLGSQEDIVLPRRAGAELRRWRWVTFDAFVDAAWEVRRPVYRRLRADWGP